MIHNTHKTRYPEAGWTLKHPSFGSMYAAEPFHVLHMGPMSDVAHQLAAVTAYFGKLTKFLY
jgi:hypothetical protein